MVDRIKKIADYWQLSPTAFADKIEVARPVISHVFSERNRPSLEVVQKIGMAFPEVDPDWLLFGKGEMLRKMAENPEVVAKVAEAPGIPEAAAATTVSEKIPEPVQKKKTTDPYPNYPAKPGRQIKKVMVFYTDHSVEVFDPKIEN